MVKLQADPLAIRNHLLGMLSDAQHPLSTRAIGSRLRLSKVRLPDYQIITHLRELLKDGDVILQGCKWVATTPCKEEATVRDILNHNARFDLPVLSPQTIARLKWQTPSKESPKPSAPESEPGVFWETVEAVEEAQLDLTGRWALFRRLVAYYRQCIRNEEGAEAFAYQNQLGDMFLYLRKVGVWYPRPGLVWQSSIPLGQHLSGLVNKLPGPSDEDALVVGYPIQAFFKEREGEPDLSMIRPIFHFPVEYSIVREALLVRSDNPNPEVNLNWLEFAFKKNPAKQRSFLSACGFINRSRPNDESPGLERGETPLSLEVLTSALKVFMSEKIMEPLHIDSISDSSLREPFKSGIYNRAVLMIAKKTRFSVTLLKELSAIEKAPDEELDRSALRMVFTKDNANRQGLDDRVHEELVIDTTPLNAEQRWAVASLLDKPLTVVTGPPGTGKSQVVSAAATNARLQNKTVLFASRNHKAIDAVYNRLVDVDGRPLIVRTNSKEDPNLNFTFSHAIKEMLRDQANPDAAQRLEHMMEEIAQLLSIRGEIARIARQCAHIGTDLGGLEERMGYLGRELPHGMVPFLEAKPSFFPHKSISRISKAANTLALISNRQSIAGRVNKLFCCLALLPWYRRARKRLRAVPGSPDLPPWPTPNGLQAFYRDLLMLEKAAEYVRLRLKSLPLEAEARKLPPLEQLTVSIADMSKRLEEIAPRAINLDVDSRRGLPPGADREEMGGLGPSLRAMRTGLDEGRIRAKILKVLKKGTPYVLKSFPCWAVTNLSAGSRLPLIAGMFDLLIVDEASQSDIPSAIPLLFRAKRAGVVGDPFQLTHCSKISTARDTLLRREIDIKRVNDVRFAYSEHSLYDLFAGTSRVEPIFLSETYRSAADIAGYSNSTFYNGRLRVATDMSRLQVPYGFKPGIHWTEIVGEVQSGGGSGCFCREEVEAVAHIVREMLVENDFRGTLGIVTPFRQQANRIRDVLYESDTALYHALVRAHAHIDTAHGFQGDERDVIIFSLCVGPDMPNGSRGFLRQNPNLFNVAVSRARAVLHIVGNRDWARRSKIRHIERLASPPKKDTQDLRRGPWHPHESPWEKIFFDALVAEGLDPRPQFPVASRRLDMALIKEGNHLLKIDIEVDGDCHRNPDGTRKLDDTWRDMQLQALGWKVLRFWTYKLRENLGDCVKCVLKTWSEHE